MHICIYIAAHGNNAFNFEEREGNAKNNGLDGMFVVCLRKAIQRRKDYQKKSHRNRVKKKIN